MWEENSSADSVEFLAVAQREGLLPPAAAASLSHESSERRIPADKLAIERGILTAVQVEIVETLLHPRTAIVGYEILGLLGYGGMGTVYRARQISLGRIVALKTVQLAATTSQNRISRFEREAQTVGKLLHPHIVTAYDFGRDGNRFYLAMELVDGEDLERRISRDGPLSEAMTWGLIRQAAAGLAQAAEFGVIHRDIKPANLLLVTPPKGFPLPFDLPMVKIADFGLALMTKEHEPSRMDADHSVVGSPHYMAPEQLGRGEVDLRADVYGLGATAYQMLIGQPPFFGLTLEEVFVAKRSRSPEPVSSLRDDLSPDTVALVEEMLARDPERRIANYALLMERIDAVLPTSRLTSARVSPKAVPPNSTDNRSGGETKTSFGTLSEPMPTVAAAPAPRRPFEVIWRLATAVALLVGVGYGISVWRHWPQEAVIQPGVDLVPSGAPRRLFDGQSLAKWQKLDGDWHTEEDEHGDTVLAASGGLIARSVMRESADDQRLERIGHYRLQFKFRQRDAAAIELSFGLRFVAPESEARLVLRVERERVQLGRQAERSLQTEPIVPAIPWSLDPQRDHEVRIERQAGEWRVSLDDRLVGVSPLAAHENERFRLSVTAADESKQAWFKDFVVVELVPP